MAGMVPGSSEENNPRILGLPPAHRGRRLASMTTLDSPTSRMAVVLSDREGETIRAHGNVLVMKTLTPRVTVIDYTAPAGFPGPPLHIHPAFDEVFIVLDGTLTVRVHDQVTQIGPIGSASVSGSVPHTFANE